METKDEIWMVEIKAKVEIDATDTQEKKKAALEYCRHATDYNSKNGGKPWGYLLVPDEEVASSRNFDFYRKTYRQEGES